MVPKTGTMTDEDTTAVLEVMEEEGRANPYLIRERTGLDKGTVNTSLVTLIRRGEIRQITRGLYENIESEGNLLEKVLELGSEVDESEWRAAEWRRAAERVDTYADRADVELSDQQRDELRNAFLKVAESYEEGER